MTLEATGLYWYFIEMLTETLIWKSENLQRKVQVSNFKLERNKQEWDFESYKKSFLDFKAGSRTMIS